MDDLQPWEREDTLRGRHTAVQRAGWGQDEVAQRSSGGHQATGQRGIGGGWPVRGVRHVETGHRVERKDNHYCNNNDDDNNSKGNDDYCVYD